MSEPSSNKPRKSGVLPPPPATGDDAPHSVTVPPLEPPPRSLEALVKSRVTSNRKQVGTEVVLWVLLVLGFALGVAITLYFKG